MNSFTPQELAFNFKKLYREDEEFKKNVDAVRSEIFNPYREPDVYSVLAKFNKLAERLGIPPFEKKEEVFLPKTIFELDYEEPVLREEEIPDLAKILPTIAQPRVDIERGNKLCKIYAQAFREAYGFRNDRVFLVEVTLVFESEYDPEMGVYNDLWRLISWGRVEDVETFFLIYDSDSLTPVEVMFPPLLLKFPYKKHYRYIPPSFSGELSFQLTAHSMARLKLYSEPVIYVNTWNHALSIFYTNLDLEKTLFKPRELKLIKGRRLEAENDLSMLKYDGEIALLEEGE